MNVHGTSQPNTNQKKAGSHFQATIEELYRNESRRVYATLIRLIGNFELAEDVMHEAFAAAIEQWVVEGIPKNPTAWLVSVGRFKAIDAIRRKNRLQAHTEKIVYNLDLEAHRIEDLDEARFQDDQLRLIFTCCHPALSPETQVALTLREICGLKTEEVASAFLSMPATIAQRIVRGKAKIRDAKIPYQIPTKTDLPERLDSVLSVIYLVFNEGYSASSGEMATRPDLSSEAIHLCRMLLNLLPDPEVMGLLALMLLHDSRRTARVSSNGDIILLDDQDRTLWNREQIEEGKKLVEQALSSSGFGTYSIQAAISAVHADAQSFQDTDWAQIVSLYDLLMNASPTPIVELNRAVAVAMRDEPQAGLDIINAILERGDLAEYHLIYAAKADLYRRIGNIIQAKTAYEKALQYAKQEPERRFLQSRLSQMK